MPKQEIIKNDSEPEKGITEPVEKVISALALPEPEKPLIADDKFVSYCEEAIGCIKEDRAEAEDKYTTFADLVLNSGDASTSSKEAMVNLLKVKSDGVNQMIKILDLWTRIKMKDKSTSSQVYAYQQNNKYEVASTPNQHVRKLIKLAQEMDKNDDES